MCIGNNMLEVLRKSSAILRSTCSTVADVLAVAETKAHISAASLSLSGCTADSPDLPLIQLGVSRGATGGEQVLL